MRGAANDDEDEVVPIAVATLGKPLVCPTAIAGEVVARAESSGAPSPPSVLRGMSETVGL